jgi:DNA-3-methyladenine glycosylase II
LHGVDSRFKTLIKQHGAPSYTRTRNAFQSLARSIVYQQLHGNAAGTIFRRFQELFPDAKFPSPEALLAVSMTRLRSVGLSQAKASYLLALAEGFRDGQIQPRRFAAMSDGEISAALKQVRGVGQWTADMFLMFGLNRPDVLPVGDFAVRKAMTHFFSLRGRVKEARLVAMAEPWRPYRSVASWYMWRVSETM